jgi:hypothetical protein
MTFHEDFAQIVGQGLSVQTWELEPGLWESRFYTEDGDTARLIQYRITEEPDLEILTLFIADEPEGGGHILRIAAESADLFKSAGFKKIKGQDFTTTDAGLAFQEEAKKINGYDEGDFTALDIDDFQKLVKIKTDKDSAKDGKLKP